MLSSVFVSSIVISLLILSAFGQRLSSEYGAFLVIGSWVSSGGVGRGGLSGVGGCFPFVFPFFPCPGPVPVFVFPFSFVLGFEWGSDGFAWGTGRWEGLGAPFAVGSFGCSPSPFPKSIFLGVIFGVCFGVGLIMGAFPMGGRVMAGGWVLSAVRVPWGFLAPGVFVFAARANENPP